MATQHTFLIVDDDENIRKILKVRLSAYFENCIIEECGYILDARDKLQLKSYDLVFLDQHLPDGLGVEISVEIENKKIPIIAMSSDESPQLPGESILKGASTFIPKSQLSNQFLNPLIEAIIEKNKLQKLAHNELQLTLVIETVKKLVRTLKHEINNPLGAVYGATYVLSQKDISEEDKLKALELLSQSAKRINEVVQKLSDATALDVVEKGKEELFHVPGDEHWKNKI